MELENSFILIAGFAGSCWLHCHINIYRNPKLGQVNLITSGLSIASAIMLELFKETPKDVTYTLMELENIYWIEMLSYQVIRAMNWGFSLPYFTCAVNAVSEISWFACTNVKAFSVVTENIGAAVLRLCLTLVDVCKMVK